MSIVEAWLVAWRQRNGRPGRAGNRSAKKAGPGWYADPRGQAPYRRWDGSRWTDDTANELPVPGGPPSPSEDADNR